jgi:hypothetical protein
VTSVVRGRRADLESERNFLLDSIADLDREHAAGDLDDTDYQSLRSDYVRRAAASVRALQELDSLSDDQPPAGLGPDSSWQRFRRYLGRRRVRQVLGVSSVVFLLAGVGLYAAHLAGVRLPGQSATGSITQSQAALIAQELDEANVAADEGQPQTAVLLYDTVLAKLPDQQVALTYGGWLTRLSGLDAHNAAAVRAGDIDLGNAARLHPGYADGEGLYGIALYQDNHDVTAAEAAFSACAADRPSKALVGVVAPVARTVFAHSGHLLPKVFAAA